MDRNYCHVAKYRRIPVALRKESVDRNRPVAGFRITLGGRSPQGERG